MVIFFKKKIKKTEIYSPLSGEVCDLSSASDPVFREKMMGDGFYVMPNSLKICSPIDGIIDSIFPTKHALTIKGKNGINTLIHIGSDTVQLEGKPFELLVEAGKTVEAGEALVISDFDYIRNSNKGTEVYVVFPELDVEKKVILIKQGMVSQQDIVATI
ncbi:PTS glucose transporter subunit IIA [Enterococcus hulanensis]|uniref:PTS sugar transporter subunit IIA n=1 Tax=Enterococcus hulanensis TaxID=2559929 RepID=UPI001A8CA7C2|nr:PTS glucose transporter subunit IIA [Enterococcus hulanensis]MBO0458157.1 PTS glucose transporter subunit IIA [Enterococcus hulanensis]